MVLGKRIKEEREKQDWTQDQLAEKLHVSRQAISKWEVGSAYPDIERLIQLSDLFTVSLDSLIKGDENLRKQIVIADNHRPMNIWEFLNNNRSLIIPVAGLIFVAVIVIFGNQ